MPNYDIDMHILPRKDDSSLIYTSWADLNYALQLETHLSVAILPGKAIMLMKAINIAGAIYNFCGYKCQINKD